jgi:hypothetical protein
MALVPNADHLGPPAIKIAGLSIWIHGRQFPEAKDYWDGNWLNVSVCCEALGATVWTAGPILMTSDINTWREQCEKLLDRMDGEASLQPLEPNLEVNLRSTDRHGHVLMRVEITPNHMEQEHRFDFSIDQSFVTELISQCDGILKEFPIRGALKM